jgi:hypothetical protein
MGAAVDFRDDARAGRDDCGAAFACQAGRQIRPAPDLLQLRQERLRLARFRPRRDQRSRC